MAEDIEQGDTEDEEESGGHSGKKLGLIIGLAVLLIGGGIGAAYFFGLFDSLLGKEESAATEQSHGEAPADAEPMLDEHGNPIEAKITYYQMPDFLINLSSASNQTSFIKMKVTLKLPSEKDQEIVTQRLPEIQNEFNTYLRDLRSSDLAGSAGMYRLQEELLARANRILAPEARVDKILFTEILIQ
jgi:flagellar protein FliL